MTGRAKQGGLQKGDKTPWDETYDELAAAILDDKESPPVLLMAAFLHKHGEPRPLHGLINDAIALRDTK